MKSHAPTLLLAVLLPALAAAARGGRTDLPRSAPEAQGVSSAGVLAFLEAADPVDTLNSFMLVRHGHVVAEGWWAPYDAASRHELYSLSKSFTSTAVGLAVAEGLLSVDDEVLKFFPGDAPAEPGANLRAMRVRDLLTMSTGHQDEPPTAPDKVSPARFLAHPVPHKPGTHFRYNTAATFMQSAIVEKVTGRTVLDYLQPRLFAPLGISGPTWGTNFQGVTLGGYGLSVRTEDIAKFGQLYLQQGRWQGRQLLPAAWVAEATGRQVSNGSNPRSDWDQGYGYQFWRCRHGAYRGDGAFGQYCLVLPEQDAVVAITGGVKDMQAVLNLVWDRLLPALKPRRLPADAAARRQLEAKLAGLAVRTPEGGADSPAAGKVHGRTFVFPANEQGIEAIRLSAPDPGGWTLTRTLGGTAHEIRCGHGRWLKGEGPLGSAPAGALGPAPQGPLAASAAWTGGDTFTVKLCAYGTPFYTALRLRFEGDRVFLDAENNVGFGPTKRPQLVGRAE